MRPTTPGRANVRRFAQRSTDDELMDDPSIGGPELNETLRQLTGINTILGGYPPSVNGVLRLLDAAPTATLLDVGTGAADAPRRLVDACAARGIRLDVTAIDLAAATAAYAREACRAYSTIHVEQGDLFALLPGRHRYDIVHAAMVLHHFPDALAVRALAKMYHLADRGVVVNDLHRHPLAYYGIRALSALAWRNRLIRHDAPVSVLRGFTAPELRTLAARAGWPPSETRLRWWPLFRWQLVADKTGRASQADGRADRRRRNER